MALGASLILALRAVPAPGARLSSMALQSPPVPIFTHPVMAATINAGGLWLLHTTDLHRLAHTSKLLPILVHVHVFASGYLLAPSLVGIDLTRTGHQSLSGLWCWWYPSPLDRSWRNGYPPSSERCHRQDAHTGAQAMYDGGGLLDVTLIGMLFARWCRDTRPVRTRPHTHSRVGSYSRRSAPPPMPLALLTAQCGRSPPSTGPADQRW